MASKIFINLPVSDLERSKAFYTRLGFSVNPQFTDENAACIVISEGSIYVMLLTHAHFKNFTRKEISDAHKSTEVLLAIDAAGREEVDELVKNAVATGGSVYMEPQDHGWMYQHSFADPDGHQWEVVYMDESAIPQE